MWTSRNKNTDVAFAAETTAARQDGFHRVPKNCPGFERGRCLPVREAHFGESSIIIQSTLSVESQETSQAADREDAGGLKRLMPVATCAWDRPSRRARRESTPP